MKTKLKSRPHIRVLDTVKIGGLFRPEAHPGIVFMKTGYPTGVDRQVLCISIADGRFETLPTSHPVVCTSGVFTED